MTAATAAVLDSSAILAWLQREPGGDVVEPLLDGGVMSAANWAEVLQKARSGGVDPAGTAASLKALGVRVEAVLEDDAARIAELWFSDSSLSLGDRCCLALGTRLGAQAVTAEHRWSDLADVDVLLIR